MYDCVLMCEMNKYRLDHQLDIQWERNIIYTCEQGHLSLYIYRRCHAVSASNHRQCSLVLRWREFHIFFFRTRSPRTSSKAPSLHSAKSRYSWLCKEVHGRGILHVTTRVVHCFDLPWFVFACHNRMRLNLNLQASISTFAFAVSISQSPLL